MARPAPRLYAQVATAAPLAAVFRRGPSGWWQVSRWHLDTGALEPGAWFHGTLYPRRSDLSPDGELLCIFALKGGPADFLGGTYSAVSKAPWLFALAAWPEMGTWTRGYHFAAGRGAHAVKVVAHGSLPPLAYRLQHTPVAQYAAERRRGWVEHASSPPRAADDTWDERRRAVLTRPRPGARDEALVLRDTGWDPAGAIEGRRPDYALEGGRHAGPLAGVVWADWDPRGRLLVATADGRLEVRALRARVITVEVAHDLSPLTPDPAPAPGWAQRW